MTKGISQRSIKGALAWAGASLLAASAALAQTEVDWADVEGRIQYAYYTNDSRALNGVLASLKPKAGEEANDADPGTRAYFRALAHYRHATWRQGAPHVDSPAVVRRAARHLADD